MVDTNFTLISGTYIDEQDLLYELDYFLTQTIQGWTQIEVIADTASDKHIAYYNQGSNPGQYDTMFLRIRATSDQVEFYGCSLYDPVTDTSSDQMPNSQGSSYQLPTGTSSGTYWIMANKDAVHIVVDHLNGNYRHGGFGHWITYYSSAVDPKPFYVFGQSAQEQTFASTNWRLVSYGPRSWGTSYNTTGSGVERVYECPHPAEVAYGTPNPRSGEPKLIEPVFYCNGTYLYYEIRGEMPGLYMCGGYGYTLGELVTISGTPGTVSGTYFWYKHTDDICWAIGPVTVSGGV